MVESRPLHTLLSAAGDYETIVFDFDGTIADTMPWLRAIAVAVLTGTTSWSAEQALKAYDDTTGMPFLEQCQTMLPDDPRNEERNAWFEKCKVALMPKATPHPMAKIVVGYLARAGHKVHLVSSTNVALVGEFVSRYDLPFKTYNGWSVGQDKAWQIAQCKGGRTLFVGDSKRDADYAARAGVEFAWVY